MERYKVNKFLFLFLMFPAILSCQDKRLDWAKTDPSIPLDSITSTFETQPYDDDDALGMKLYKSYDKGLLYFNGTKLDGREVTNNSAILYVSKMDERVIAISLFTEDIEHTEALVKAAEACLGDTDYHYYYAEDNTPARDKIWKKADRYYTLRVKDPDYLFGIKTKTACLTVFNSESTPFVRWWFYEGGDFSGFYGQYIDECEKPDHKNKQYRYKDFVEQMDREHKNQGTTSQFFVP